MRRGHQNVDVTLRHRLVLLTEVRVFSCMSCQVYPIQGFPDQEICDVSTKMINEHLERFSSTSRILQQVQSTCADLVQKRSVVVESNWLITLKVLLEFMERPSEVFQLSYLDRWITEGGLQVTGSAFYLQNDPKEKPSCSSSHKMFSPGRSPFSGFPWQQKPYHNTELR